MLSNYDQNEGTTFGGFFDITSLYAVYALYAEIDARVRLHLEHYSHFARNT